MNSRFNIINICLNIFLWFKSNKPFRLFLFCIIINLIFFLIILFNFFYWLKAQLLILLESHTFPHMYLFHFTCINRYRFTVLLLILIIILIYFSLENCFLRNLSFKRFYPCSRRPLTKSAKIILYLALCSFQEKLFQNKIFIKKKTVQAITNSYTNSYNNNNIVIIRIKLKTKQKLLVFVYSIKLISVYIVNRNRKQTKYKKIILQ